MLADCDLLNSTYSQMGMAEISAVKYLAENGQEYREYQLSKMQTFDLIILIVECQLFPHLLMFFYYYFVSLYANQY